MSHGFFSRPILVGGAGLAALLFSLPAGAGGIADPRVGSAAERAFLDSISDELSRLRTRLRTLSEPSLQRYVTGVGMRVAREALEVWRALSRYVRDAPAVEGWLFARHSTVEARVKNLTREIERRYAEPSAAGTRAVGEECYRRALSRHEALSAFSRGDFAASARAFERLVAEDPADAEAHLYLGNVYRAMEKGPAERALREYEAALRAEPSLAAAEREMGSYFYLLGDYASAAPHLARYVERAAEAPDAQEVRDQLRTCRALADGTPPSSDDAVSAPRLVADLLGADRRRRDDALRRIRDEKEVAADLVPALVASLDTAERGARADVARALGFVGPAARAAVPRLIALSRGGEPDVRDAAITALGGIGTAAAEAVPTLTELLADERLAGRAAAALGGIGPAAREALPGLVGLLRSPSSSPRVSAAIAIGEIGADPSFAPAAAAGLAVALSDGSISVREQSALALAKLGPRAAPAVPALIEALNGDVPSVRRYAAYALGEIGAAAGSALPALRGGVAATDCELSQASADAIGKIEIVQSKKRGSR